MPNIVHTLGLTIVAVLKVVFKSVVGFNRHASLSRSAVFLIAFIVVHALGNLSLFGGQGAFNRYGHALTSNPLLKFIEYYLLLAGAVHLLSASYNTLKDGKLQAKWTWRSLSLSITGTVILAFLIVHLQTFRFGVHYKYVTADGEVIRDLHRLAAESFASPWYSAFYVVSVTALLLHLRGGWKRTVLRLGLPKEHRAGARAIGEVMALGVCGAFAAVVAYAHFQLSPP